MPRFIEVLRTLAARPEMVNRLRLAELDHLAEAARLQPALQCFPQFAPLPSLDGPGAISRLLEGLRGVLLAILAENEDSQGWDSSMTCTGLTRQPWTGWPTCCAA